MAGNDMPEEGADRLPVHAAHATDGKVIPADVWHLTVAYDGTGFCGWQLQPDQRTVHGELQKRLRRLFCDPGLRLAATSRTDAGVHALDQHVSFPVPSSVDADPVSIRRRLNRWLPDDIKVLRIQTEQPTFHARHCSCGKAYTYVLDTSEKPHPLFSRFVWHIPVPLDSHAMHEAARHLTGKHDFASFAVNPKRDVPTTVKTIHRLDISRQGGLVFFNVVGDSFLYKMVRSIVGFLVHIGKGGAQPGQAQAVLEARDRCAAADSAPAQGLFLARVFLEPDQWEHYSPLLPPFAWTAETHGLSGRPGD